VLWAILSAKPALLVEICGAKKVAAFKEVKLTSMRWPAWFRRSSPKNSMEICHRAESSSSRRARASGVLLLGRTQIRQPKNSPTSGWVRGSCRFFGEVDHQHQARGWLTVDELYTIHGARFDPNRVLKKLAERLS
jgi:hypothetical protein